MTDDQLARYREAREIDESTGTRQTLIDHLQEEIDGLGVLDDWWTAEIH
ncbi:hypothetical protein [Nocardiopsis sp. CNT312]|nr:hypothetical protein [Nocardiopsis sp. CNT312]